MSGLTACLFQPLQQVAAAFGERVDHAVAGAAERQRDVLALVCQRMGDALRGFAHAIGDEVADGGNVLAEVEMDAGDGVAYLLGLADQRVALAGEVVQQAANADFVVVIGPLQRGDLVMHERFQFGGARQRALHPVAHGGDFAANCVTDGNDQLVCHGLRLGETDGDFRHGLRDQPQFLRTRD